MRSAKCETGLEFRIANFDFPLIHAEGKVRIVSSYSAATSDKVFDKAFVAIHIVGGTQTRELEKFADKMGLIEVSENNRKIRPIGRGIMLDESPGLLKPLNPAEQFRRHAYFRLENLNEPTLA